MSKIKKAFLLTAGFGKRLAPQTHFYPKPALPFFNLPLALYPAALARDFGVEEFFYNAHHLPKQLEAELRPYFKNAPLTEKFILDSAGGIANAKEKLEGEENFLVLNGDSYISFENSHFLEEAFEIHKKENRLCTLLGIPNKFGVSGLKVEPDQSLKQIKNSKDAAHFIGIYIFSREIFEYIQPEPQHIFRDILLKDKLKPRVRVYNVKEGLNWYETGNERDFIHCMKQESHFLKAEREKSMVYRVQKIWSQESEVLDLENQLEHFLGHSVWGLDFVPKKKMDFLCLPPNSSGNLELLSNCQLVEGLNYKGQQEISNSLLVDSSQWAT